MMNRLWIRVKSEAIRFWTETDGQDLVEYALIIAAIALGMIAVMKDIATALSSVYQNILTGVSGIGTPS
jgi:Flp pilus assembly pilin Flp